MFATTLSRATIQYSYFHSPSLDILKGLLANLHEQLVVCGRFSTYFHGSLKWWEEVFKQVQRLVVKVSFCFSF